MEIETGRIYNGDAIETLRELPEESVHCLVTSPPYWGLRDYGVDGQLGLEDSYDEYIEKMVEFGEAAYRVLRSDGSLYLNLGDKYRRKNKLMLPHRVAIALTNEVGFTCRNDILWEKSNSMPHPTTDRLINKFEFVFHLTKNKQYFYDLDAIRVPHAESSLQRVSQNDGNPIHEGEKDRDHPTSVQTLDANNFVHEDGANPGDIIECPPAQFSDAHFAVFPEELIERPILSSCPPTVCADCQKPYERVDGEDDGWEKQCECDTEETEPGIVLDPFMGAGTTGIVAKKFGRRWVGIELNEEYVEMAYDRISETDADLRRWE